jgi:hypothetical protein
LDSRKARQVVGKTAWVGFGCYVLQSVLLGFRVFGLNGQNNRREAAISGFLIPNRCIHLLGVKARQVGLEATSSILARRCVRVGKPTKSRLYAKALLPSHCNRMASILPIFLPNSYQHTLGTGGPLGEIEELTR